MKDSSIKLLCEQVSMFKEGLAEKEGGIQRLQIKLEELNIAHNEKILENDRLQSSSTELQARSIEQTAAITDLKCKLAVTPDIKILEG